MSGCERNDLNVFDDLPLLFLNFGEVVAENADDQGEGADPIAEEIRECDGGIGDDDDLDQPMTKHRRNHPATQKVNKRNNQCISKLHLPPHKKKNQLTEGMVFLFRFFGNGIQEQLGVAKDVRRTVDMAQTLAVGHFETVAQKKLLVRNARV